MPTIKDVAKACGVSYPTVSYVFNNSRPVSQETRELVLRTAREMGYSPNNLARGLVTKRTYTIGVLVNNFHYSTSLRIINAIENAARERQYRLLLGIHHGDTDQALGELQEFANRSIDGVIYVSSTDDGNPDVVKAIIESSVPAVLAYTTVRCDDNADGKSAIDAVLPDHVEGGRIATDRLISLGRRRIAFIGSRSTNNATRKRLEGYKKALADNGLAFDSDLIRYARYTAPAGRRAAIDIFRSQRPDAVFAADDSIAAGVIQACHKYGLRVPEDVAVVGFNDSILCRACDPWISSIAMPFNDIGNKCIERLVNRLEKPQEWHAETIYLPCKLVERQSG